MGKNSNDFNGSYSANRSSGYNQNRSRSCENSARCRGYESEYANRSRNSCGENQYANRSSDACCENQYANRSSDACCENSYAGRSSDSCCEEKYASGYAWRSSAYSDRSGDSCLSCPAELHLHEVQGSTQVAESGCEAHSHRFATVTSEPVILKNGKHAHKLTFRTDTYDGHCHEFCGMTTEEYEICDGHVHYCEGKTSESDGHCHEFKFITHIENPTED